MPADKAAHATSISWWLDRLGCRTVGLAGHEVLRGGISGATTYQLLTSSGALILKLVPPESPPRVLERGAREIAFYRSLAGTLPLATPEVMAWWGPSRDGCALLLRAYEPLPEIVAWTDEAYGTAARQLASLHAVYWNETDRLNQFGWLRQPADDLRSQRHNARAAWRALWDQQRLVTVFRPAIISRIEAELETPVWPASRTRPPVMPYTLCHGDAHHENLLEGHGGGWVWSDWQEVGIGLGPDDLSFFHQRATAAGGRVDLRRMVQVYQAELENRTGVTIDLGVIHHVMAEFELRTRLLHWPSYLTSAPLAAIERHVERVMDLMDYLQRRSSRTGQGSS